MNVSIDSWEEDARGVKRWQQSGGHAVRYKVGSLAPGTAYTVAVGNIRHRAFRADSAGTITFAVPGSSAMRRTIVVRPTGRWTRQCCIPGTFQPEPS